MRQTLAVALTVICAVLVDATVMAQTPHAEGGRHQRRAAALRGSASIAGRVLVAGSDTPVRGAEVLALSDGGTRLTATTDDSGAYRLDQLPEGEWRLTASRAGFITWQYGQRRPFEVPPPVTLAEGEEFTADIPLTRGGAITGRVFNEFGEPVAATQVRAYRAHMERGARRLSAVGVADMTDDTGSFRVYGLPPGEYYVGASLRLAPVDSVVQTTFSPTYFPGTGDLADAQRIRIGLGQEASIVLPLLPVHRVRVSGVVLSSSGAPADAYLNLESEAAELGVPLGIGGVTRRDGTFTIADVPPGRYRLIATLRGDGPEETGSTSVVVDSVDLAGTTLMTGRAASLHGVIELEGSAARRLPRNLEVAAIAARPGRMVLGSGSGTTFEIAGLSEPFYLSVNGLPDGWGVKDVLVNDTSTTDHRIELAPGERAEVRVLVSDRLAELAGVVSPMSASSRFVVVFPDDSSKWGHDSRYVRVTRTDAEGAFRIAGLPPGDGYRVLATDYLDDGEHDDPEFLAEMLERAQAVSVEEGARRDVELTLVER
jgi:hypothetical protein